MSLFIRELGIVRGTVVLTGAGWIVLVWVAKELMRLIVLALVSLVFVVSLGVLVLLCLMVFGGWSS